MLPVIALVGRPNVGKSTLFNRLTKSRDAIVADYAGLTRDRQYGEGEFQNQRFICIDTGGISGDEQGIDAVMAGQSLTAIDEADIVLFLVDARAGLTAADQLIASELRKRNTPFHVVVNKVDGTNPDIALGDFYQFGQERLWPTTATHGKGIKPLLTELLKAFPPTQEQIPESKGIRIAVIGRPNVGKSTLVNRLLGEDRVVVFDQPGTTRDSIYIDYERDGEPYTIIDTAGVRRRKNVKEAVEKFSIVKTLQAVDDANVVVLVFDGREAIVDQDLHLLGHIIDSGRAIVLAINKWDGLSTDQRQSIRNDLERRLQFIDFARMHFISALHGSGVGDLYKSIHEAYEAASRKLSTPMLTRILESATEEHQPPLVNGRRIKLRYAHAGGANPPIIVIHGNQTDKLPSHYVRYLEKYFRKALKMVGTPIRIELRTSDNPYKGRKNKLTARQESKRKRMIKHLKKRGK